MSVMGIVKTGKHHRGGIVGDGTEHGVMLVVGEFVGPQRPEGGHVVPPEEEISWIGAHVAVMHRRMHAISIVVLIALGMSDRLMMAWRTELVAHKRPDVAAVHERVEHVHHRTALHVNRTLARD